MEFLLSVPVLATCLLALRWRLPQVSIAYIPAAAIADPYVAAMAMGVVIAVRATIGRELIVAERIIGPLVLCSVWLVYSFVLLPIGSSPLRWISELLQLILGMIALLLYCSSIIDRKDLASLARGLLYAAALLSLIAVFRYFFGLSISSSGPLGPTPYNYSSIIILIGLACVVSRVDRSERDGSERFGLGRLALIGLLLVGVFANESRAALVVSLFLVASQFVIGRKSSLLHYLRRVAVVLAVLVVLSVSVGQFTGITQMLMSLVDFSGYNFSNLERLALLVNSYELFVSNPAGHGIGSSSELFANSPFTEGNYPHPHNTLAMFAVELGVVGVALYVALVFALVGFSVQGLRHVGRDPRTASFCILSSIALLSTTVFEALFFNGSLALNIFICLGMLWAASSMLREESGRVDSAKEQGAAICAE